PAGPWPNQQKVSRRPGELGGSPLFFRRSSLLQLPLGFFEGYGIPSVNPKPPSVQYWEHLEYCQSYLPLKPNSPGLDPDELQISLRLPQDHNAYSSWY